MNNFNDVHNLGRVNLVDPVQLTSLLPHDGPFDESLKFITINTLLNEADVQTFNKAVCIVLLYPKAANKLDGEVSFYNRTSSGKKSYEKMIVGMDINADEGDNIVVFLWGKGQNEMMFHRCGHLRDNGVMGECCVLVYM